MSGSSFRYSHKLIYIYMHLILLLKGKMQKHLTLVEYSKVSIQFQCTELSFEWLAKHLFSLILSQSSNHLFFPQVSCKEIRTKV